VESKLTSFDGKKSEAGWDLQAPSRCGELIEDRESVLLLDI